MEKKIEEKFAAPASSKNDNVLVLLKSASVGVLFGFALEKSKVYDPQIILDQMILKRFIMLKMFFSALTTSTLVVLVYRSQFPDSYAKIFESMRDQLKKKSMLSLVIGGSILGFGMTLGGSCPGMIFVQLGAGVSNAYVSLLGGLVGAYLHGYLSTSLSDALGKPNPKASATLYEMMGVKPKIVHLGLAGFLLGSAVLLELVFPWKNDFKISTFSYGLNSKIWPPIYAGLILGSSQLISFILAKRPLGNSTTFSICASQLFSQNQLNGMAYMKKFRWGNWDRVSMSLGVLAGSFMSANLGGVYGAVQGVSMLKSFAGGFMLIFGARLADGCNTGHGISGTANLFFGSAIATMAMFGSAMASYWILNYQ